MQKIDNGNTMKPFPHGTLVWLGPPFFAPWLEECGWHVVQQAHDLSAPRTFSDILSLTGGEPPRVVVVADASTPPPVLGTHAFPCLTLFYSVDSHIHSWHPLYAQGFDLCLVSLKDHLSRFVTGRLHPEQVIWSPPFALDRHRPPGHTVDPLWDLLFVGTVDPVLTPERYAFITALRQAFPPLHVERGNFSALFPQARLLLNECAAGDLNFRVFEALGCGGCLLTPHIGNGLTDLFTDGEELFLYPPYDVNALASLAERLLNDPERRHAVAARGLAAIDAGHRASHRARSLHERLVGLFRSGQAESMVQDRLSLAPRIHDQALRLLYLHHAETVDLPVLRRAYLEASRKQK